MITEVWALFGSTPNDKALLFDITMIVNLCVGGNLDSAARHAGKPLPITVDRDNKKYRGLFPATYTFLPLVMSTCGETDPDVCALAKELTIRRVEKKSEIHFAAESWHLLLRRTKIAAADSFALYSRQVIPHATSFLRMSGTNNACRQAAALIARHGAFASTSKRQEEKAPETMEGTETKTEMGTGRGEGAESSESHQFVIEVG